MSHYHACVWIDHHEAKIFGIGLEELESDAAVTLHTTHHIHRKSDHLGQGTTPIDPAFLAEIADLLQPAKAILIAGPGRAKTELAGYLTENFPLLAKRVWGIEAMDHPTDGQLVAAARKYFRAADRMHT